MDSNNIRRLIEAYYNATLSSADEAELMEYLRSDSIAPTFAADRDIILGLQGLDIPVPDDLNSRLSRNIDKWNQCSQHKRKVWRIAVSAAASLLLVLSVSISLFSRQEATDTMTPEQAYVYTQKALSIFAATINKSNAAMDSVEARASHIYSMTAIQLRQINDI